MPKEQAQEVRDEDKKATMEIRRRGRIKENGVGSDVITFSISLEGLPPTAKKLVCIVNVPDEGRDSAPVYVKVVEE